MVDLSQESLLWATGFFAALLFLAWLTLYDGTGYRIRWWHSRKWRHANRPPRVVPEHERLLKEVSRRSRLWPDESPLLWEDEDISDSSPKKGTPRKN